MHTIGMGDASWMDGNNVWCCAAVDKVPELAYQEIVRETEMVTENEIWDKIQTR